MEIKTFSATSHKIKAVIYGASGSGKTYFAATAPKPIFASAEGGLLSTLKHKKKIDPIKYVAITKIEDLRDLLAYLKKGEHDFQTVVIDSITEINEIIKDGIEKKRGAQMQLKDWGDLAKAIKAILRGFRDLDMHVIFLAQEKSEKDEDKTEKIVPSLNGKAASEIAYFMDVVGYCFVDKLGTNKLTVQPNEKLLTKARGLDLPGDAPDDFEEWIANMSAIELKDETVENVNVGPAVQLKPPVAPTPPPVQKITSETSKALFAEWKKFYDATGKDPKQSPIYMKETLKKEFNVESSRQLTEEQAKGFVERLRVGNDKKKAEAKAAKKEEKAAEIQPEEAPKADLTSTPEKGKIE